MTKSNISLQVATTNARLKSRNLLTENNIYLTIRSWLYTHKFDITSQILQKHINKIILPSIEILNKRNVSIYKSSIKDSVKCSIKGSVIANRDICISIIFVKFEGSIEDFVITPSKALLLSSNFEGSVEGFINVIRDVYISIIFIDFEITIRDVYIGIIFIDFKGSIKDSIIAIRDIYHYHQRLH
ncbi:hypothetical protein BC938DRAFT_478969 [Jimgerdemannia flammicorona]|uniref:Uncharacterized protein n=1 Tax=Jimgerdemannia flammicorona TaxID=994334 RepID=A0A433QLX9_9FUNG|nr:hypothetical protein BC938DRAFT_478969 [Jimgerdemannia flammicorona]